VALLPVLTVIHILPVLVLLPVSGGVAMQQCMIQNQNEIAQTQQLYLINKQKAINNLC